MTNLIEMQWYFWAKLQETLEYNHINTTLKSLLVYNDKSCIGERNKHYEKISLVQIGL